MTELPKAVASGVWEPHGIACHVLDDERRVMSRVGVTRLLFARDRGGRDTTTLTAMLHPEAQKGSGHNLDVITFAHSGGKTAEAIEADAFPRLLAGLAEFALDHEMTPEQRRLARRAVGLLREFAGVAFRAVVDEVTGFQATRHERWLQRQFDMILTKDPSEYRKLWQDEVVRALVSLYRMTPAKGRGFPVGLVWPVRKLYESVWGREVVDKMRELTQRSRGERMHQHLTDQSREVMSRELGVIRALACQSATAEEFWRRIRANYGDGAWQYELGV